jgi:aryl-alcohol dehydrogenase-like predicted oxidoreductase
MEYRKLGNSGLQVSVLSLGSWLTFGQQITDDVAERLMVISYEAGVNFFDNAETYANGKSELVMGKILKKLNWDRTSYIVSSKAYFGRGGLQVDYLDLYFCHRPDTSVPMEEIVWTMNQLIQQGKILYWGTSEWNATQIMEAHKVAKEYKLIGPTMEQPQYNMFWRDHMEGDYLDVFRTIGLGTTIWSPLAGGTLTGKYAANIPDDTRMDMRGMQWLKDIALTPERLDKVKQLNQLALNMGTTLAKFAIAWCAKNPNVSTVILGASKPEQLTETLTSLDVIPLITPSVTEQIEKILGNKPVFKIM